ncbi:hypothetical protein BDR06DRAFT_977088 [Suillus hirtellus]|nr:hypothetical protein BDR06DRAFT_977088 [Suillus hirtellus]
MHGGFNEQKKPKWNDQSNDSSSGNSDADKSGTSTDFDINNEALNSQETDGTWSCDEYNGTTEPGSKRGCRPSLTKKDLQYLFKATMNKSYEKTWTDVLSFIKHTSSDFSKRCDLGVYWGSATKAYLIMPEQPWHRFIISFSICAEQLHAHYCNHSGLIITLLTSTQLLPTRVADTIAALSLADPSLLGLDPTIHVCIPSCRDTHTDLAVGVIVCYRVRDPVDGKEYGMKDCWVNEVKRYHEVDVLKRVKGIPNVVQLIDHWDVLFNGEPDCTYHRHLLLTPCGDPLWDFSSRKELICAFCDFVVAHEAMIQQQILHRDLSPNNFVIHEDIGYFINFDHTSIIKEGETFTVSFSTNANIIKKSIKEKKNSNSTAQLELVEHNSSDDLDFQVWGGTW